MSAWLIFQSVSGLPFRDTDFTYLFSDERFFATTVNVFGDAAASSILKTTFSICGAPMTYSPPQGLNG